jgi:serine/threonine-protein kinase
MNAPVAVGTVIANRYRIESILGAGGMGIVVKATHLLLQQAVAIKFLRREVATQESVTRLLHEARAAAKVQSEHVVRVHDVAALDDGTPYIVMEYLEGSELSLLLENGPLPLREALKYAIQMCNALAETHAAGIIHGDLKPENVYIVRAADGSGRVKLLDFGISKTGAEQKSNAIMGTPAYMAPEQFERGTIDPRTDIYALGAVLYEMLCGKPPFQADTPELIARRVFTEKPPPLGWVGVPPNLEQIVMRCLARKSEDRFETAVELAYALEQVMQPESAAMRLERSASQRVPIRDNATSQRLIPTVVLHRERKTMNPGGWLLGLFAALAIVGIVLIVGVRTTGPAARAAPAVPEDEAASAAAEPVPTTVEAPPEPVPEPVAQPPLAAASASAAKPPPAPRPRPAVRRPPASPEPKREASPGDRFGTRK